LCKLGSDVLLVRCKKGQNKGSVSKARARITSLSSGPADAGRLTPALYETPKVKTRKPGSDVSGLMKIQIGGLFNWMVISVGGFCSR